MNEIIERTKQAIADILVPHKGFNVRSLISACFVVADGPIAIPTLARVTDLFLEAIAYAAIAAMREPTEAMVQAARQIPSSLYLPMNEDLNVSNVPEVYKRMIDAALADD